MKRTKDEIKEAINRTRQIRDGYNFTRDKIFAELCNAQLRVLRWTLGYKVGVWYWCHGCQKQHKGLECPKCGGNTRTEPKIV